MKWFLTMTAIGISIVASAQTGKVFGYIKDSATRLPVAFASITTRQTSKTRISDAQGFFQITPGIEDDLNFAAIGYKTATVYALDLRDTKDTIVVILAPLAAELPSVSVSTKGPTQYQLDSIARRAQFFNDEHDTIMPVMDKSKYDVGFTLNLEHFSKHAKNVRKTYSLFDENEKEQYINYRFNPQFVHEYTGLTGDSLQLFLERYRPAYYWLRTHPRGEGLKYYINDKLKLFFNRNN